MTAAETARANAIHCEAKKHAYRQTQDGVVVSFVLHPHEVPDGLATAALGTRYMLALVAIGDDEQPIESPTTAGGRHEVSNPTASPRSTPAQSGGAKHITNDKPSTSWHQLSAAQQAGILCSEPAFHKFLNTKWKNLKFETTEAVATAVRDMCGVTSRSQIDGDKRALTRWNSIVEEYRFWMRQPEVVG